MRMLLPIDFRVAAVSMRAEAAILHVAAYKTESWIVSNSVYTLTTNYITWPGSDCAKRSRNLRDALKFLAIGRWRQACTALEEAPE